MINIPNYLSLPRDTCQTAISGTDTFRSGHRKILSGKLETPYTNFGGNRANIEKSMRKVWCADEGYELCQVDQSGAEALIVAYLCKPGRYRQLFENNIKPHVYVALHLFPEVWKSKFDTAFVETALLCEITNLQKLPFWKELVDLIKSSDSWASNERYYHMGKKTVHAGSYGMRENKFRLAMLQESGGTINISTEDAAKFLIRFHTLFPEIHNWHTRTFETARKTKQLRNLLGFPYNITNFVDQNDYKDLIAWVPQSTVACITKQAIVKLYSYIETEKKDWHLLLSDCHDSYLAQARPTEILELAKKMKEFIEIDLVAPDGSKFKMKSEASVGKNWSSYKKDINEEGLKEVKF